MTLFDAQTSQQMQTAPRVDALGAMVNAARPVDPGKAAEASEMWRSLATRSRLPKAPKGADAVWETISSHLATSLPRQRRLMKRAQRIVVLSQSFRHVPDHVLQEEAESLRQVLRRGKDDATAVDRGFAVMREAARRVLGLEPYPEQIAAGLAIENGWMAEFATGEGKTLSATMPAAIAGWRGRGCHVITVNDYLAERDAQTMAPLFKFVGLTARAVTGEMQGRPRIEGYRADVTYTTNKEVAADLLRDQLRLGRTHGTAAALIDKLTGGRPLDNQITLRGLECAIIDEADSVLIDEAVTPLIISGDAPNAEQSQAYGQAADLAAALQHGEDYTVRPRYREVELTYAGRNRLADLTEPLGGIWSGMRRAEELVTQALVARELYDVNQQYVVEDDKIVIVDEFTGRLMPDRQWRDGMHQAVEAKEKVEINPIKQTMARISFQRFFRMYRKLGGMTGTAWEARREIWRVYRMPTVRIPTHRPCIRKQLRDRIHVTQQRKHDMIVDQATQLIANGRPVLIGTRSVAASERLSEMLTEAGLEHEVLNAVRHEQEAAIVARAGQPGRVTVATNMAGRGTDIKLGKGVADAGGLAVIAEELNESPRIDRQLFGRAGRQGDPGSAVSIISLEDDLVKRYVPATLRNAAVASLPFSSWPARRLWTFAQRRAAKLAGQQRHTVLRTDDWLDDWLGFAGREY